MAEAALPEPNRSGKKAEPSEQGAPTAQAEVNANKVKKRARVEKKSKKILLPPENMTELEIVDRPMSQNYTREQVLAMAEQSAKEDSGAVVKKEPDFEQPKQHREEHPNPHPIQVPVEEEPREPITLERKTGWIEDDGPTYQTPKRKQSWIQRASKRQVVLTFGGIGAVAGGIFGAAYGGRVYDIVKCLSV